MVYAAIHSHPVDSVDYQTAVDEFYGLSMDARAILSDSTTAITEAATRMQRDAEDLERRLVGQGLWVVPLVLVLMVLAVMLIVRPLRSLDDAIRLLGSGELDTAIAIRGPADVRDLGARLEWLRQRLLDLESDRVRLFRHVSHELKTPLTCIREGTQLLADGVAGPMTTEQREIARNVVDNAAELHRRIEDLLRLSELRTQGAALDMRATALADVVRQVVEQNTVAARGPVGEARHLAHPGLGHRRRHEAQGGGRQPGDQRDQVLARGRHRPHRPVGRAGRPVPVGRRRRARASTRPSARGYSKLSTRVKRLGRARSEGPG